MTRLQILSESKNLNDMLLSTTDGIWKGMLEFESFEIHPDGSMWQACVVFQRPVFKLVAKAVWTMRCLKCRLVLPTINLPDYVYIDSGDAGFAPQTKVTFTEDHDIIIRVAKCKILLDARDGPKAAFKAELEVWDKMRCCFK